MNIFKTHISRYSFIGIASKYRIIAEDFDYHINFHPPAIIFIVLALSSSSHCNLSLSLLRLSLLQHRSSSLRFHRILTATFTFPNISHFPSISLS